MFHSNLVTSVRLLALGASALALLWTANASAIYINFADYQGSASGNHATINAGGQSITISAQPSPFNLSISSAGLGVSCTSGFIRCITNSGTQIDAEWAESVTITFNDGPVVLNQAFLGNIFRGETAIVSTGNGTTTTVGTSLSSRDAHATVDLGHVVASQISFSARGWFSDFSVQGIDFDVFRPVVITPDPGTRPTNPVPEPQAALLFAIGMGTVSSVVRRRRS